MVGQAPYKKTQEWMYLRLPNGCAWYRTNVITLFYIISGLLATYQQTTKFSKTAENNHSTNFYYKLFQL